MNLRERAYKKLKQDIIQLKLKPGTQLIETEISSQLGVSRTPIREAIRQLVDEGLAITLSPRMTVVASINGLDVEGIYEVRQSLEILALELSFPLIELSEVEDIIRLYRGEDLDDADLFEMDVRVHHLWIKGCKNERLIAILEQLDREVTRYRLYSHRVPTREERSIAEHVQILEAIQMRDLPRTRLLLSIHLENTKNNIIEAISAN